MNGNTSTQEGLRERKHRETRLALCHATIRLCMKSRWENVTVDDIAAAANVSPRTFRNYFSTKAEAVAAGHLERMLRIAENLRTRPNSEELWTAITNSVTEQFETPQQRSELIADAGRWKDRIRFLFTEPAIQGEVLKAGAAARDNLAGAIAERLSTKSSKELYPQLVAAVVIAVIGQVLERWVRSGPSGPIVPLMRNAFELLAAGLTHSR